MATRVGTLYVRVTAKTAAFKAAMASAQSSIVSVGKFAGVAAAAMKGLGLVLTKTAAEFEQGMTRVAAVSDATAGQYKALESAALSMAAKTQFTARQVADGMGFLAMAGMDATQVIEAMPQALQLASAGMIDVATASNIVTNVMAGMGLEMHELARANDTIVSAITGSNTDVRMLGESFKFVGPVAKSAGIAFEEITAALGLLGNAGIQGSMAGTTMRGAITRLLSPSKQAKKILDEFGVTIMNIDGSMKSLEDIIRQIEFSGLADDAVGAGNMMEIFGLRAGPGMQALVSQGSDALKTFKTRLEGAGGVAARISTMQLNTLIGRFKIMMSAIEGLTIDIGQRLIPATKALVNTIADVTRWFNSWDSDTKNAVVSTAMITTGVLALTAAFSGLVKVLMSNAFKSIVLNIGKMIVPLVVVAALVVSVIAAIGALATFWEESGTRIKNTLNEIGNAFKDTWNKVVLLVGDAFKSITKLAGAASKWMEDNVFSKMRDFFIYLAGKANFLSDAEIVETQEIAREEGLLSTSGKATAEFELWIDQFVGALEVGGEAIKFGFVESGKGLVDAASWSAGKFKEGMSSLSKNFKKGFGILKLDVLLDKAMNLAGKAGTPAGLRTTAADKKLDKDPLGKGSERLAAMFEADIAFLGGEMKASLSATMDAVHQGLAEAARKTKDSIMTSVSSLVSSMGELGGLIDAGQAGFKSGGPWGAIAAVILELLAKTETFSKLTEDANSIISEIVVVFDTILTPLGALMASVREGFSVLGNAIKQILDAVMPLFAAFDVMNTLFMSMASMIAQAGSGMQLVGLVLEWLGEGLRWVARVVQDVMYNVVKAWNAVIGKLAEWVGKIKDSWGDAIRKMTIDWGPIEKAFDEAIKGPATVHTEALDELASATDAATQAMLGVPQGFKVAAAAFEAEIPMGLPPTEAVGPDAAGQAPAAGNTSNTVIIEGAGADELAAIVLEVMDRETFTATGSLKPFTSPHSVPSVL